MLSQYDDFLCHQTVGTFDELLNTDRNWAEKGYIGIDGRGVGVQVGIGIGKYANRNVMDAFGGAAVNGKQYVVRASRELTANLDNLVVGPLSYEVKNGLRLLHLVLDENEYGVAYDLEFVGAAPALVEGGGVNRRHGITLNHTNRFYQMGKARGVVKVEGKSYELKEDTTFAYRDRSWGIRLLNGVPQAGSWFFRDGMGHPESGLMQMPQSPGFLGSFIGMQFKHYCMFYTHAEGSDGKVMPAGVAGNHGFLVYKFGDPRPPVDIVAAEFEYSFYPGTRRVKATEGVFHLADGTHKQVAIRATGSVFYPRAGGYYGFRGWWQGKWMGPLVVGGDKLDLTDAATLDEVGTGEDISCEIHCDGEVGHCFLAPAVYGNLAKYGFTA